jgi:hypothetical protein
VQEEQHFPARPARPGIHLDSAAPLTADDKCKPLSLLNRCVRAVPIDYDYLDLARLIADADQTGQNVLGFVDSWYDDGDSHSMVHTIACRQYILSGSSSTVYR